MSTLLCQASCSSVKQASSSTCRYLHGASVLRASKVASAADKAAKRAKAKGAADPDAMTLKDAAAVLRAVEVGSPSSAYEITITTKYVRGQNVPRGKISLPRDARAKADTILVLASGQQSVQAATEAGAHYAGGEELFPDILASKISPTKVICTPALLPAVQKQLARFLGPKGLMPSEKRGTVTLNITDAVKLAQGTMNWKGDKLGVIRAPVARIGWPFEDVQKNVKAFMDAVRLGTTPDNQELGSVVIKKASSALQVFLSSRQGPGIRLTDM